MTIREYLKTLLQGVKTYVDEKIVKSDWNENDENSTSYINNRTHYDARVETTKTITFDGTTEGKNVINTESGYYFVKMSDDYFSPDKLIGKNLQFFLISNSTDLTIQITSDKIVQYDGYYSINTYVIFCEKDIIIEDEDLILTKGLWFQSNSGMYVSSLEVPALEGEVKPLDEMYLPETTKYQSDWNVNDEADPAFIKNRPFYGDEQTTSITHQPDEFMMGTHVYFKESPKIAPSTFPVKVGDVITINHEGVNHELIATQTGSLSNSITYGAIGSESGVELTINTDTYEYGINIHYSKGVPTMPLTISYTSGEIKKIDPKYLPDNIGGGDSLPVGSEVLVDADAEVPEGWEVVDEKYDASEVYLPDGQTIETALNNKLDKSGGEITGNLSVSGTIAAPDGNNIGGQRLNNSHIGFFPTHEDALNNTNRKGWIGVADTNALTIDSQASSSLRFQVKSGSGLEWYSAGTTYIDFHTNWTTNDYSQRLFAPASGNMVAYPGISNGSDRRLKKDIEDIDEKYLNILKGLSTKTFKYIRWDDGLKIGFIAQDVEEVLKENGIEDMPIIAQNGEDGTYTLDYSQIASLLVYGWQNHEQIIIEQEVEINNLKSELSELKDLVNKLINTKGE